MSPLRYLRPITSLALVAALSGWSANAFADDDDDHCDSREVKHVFVIALENHNWTQPASETGIQQIYQNPNAPFINSLVNGTAQVYVNSKLKNISKQVSYATAYHNVLATPSGNNPSIHPSEPNYIWAEAGTNFGILNDNDPYGPGGTNQNTDQHLTGLLQKAGKTWRSYQEDTDLQTESGGALTNLPLPFDQWTSPISSFSGVFAQDSNLNASNASSQYNYACKHNPQIFFTDTNGGDDPTPANPLSHNYAPLQQLAFDLANDNVADYVWITPDQYNDMHSSLSNPFDGLTGDSQNIRQGDNAISRLVPLIMSSHAYKDGGAIILWWDESEGGDDFSHTLGEIVISPLAHPNVGGRPYASSVNYTHSSDLRTWQEVFHVKASGSSVWLGDAANATDLSDLFAHGVIPKNP